ncbi:MAG: UDP-N-acetylmuramate--L-alanine ligase [Flavobacteriaceae bacterium]
MSAPKTYYFIGIGGIGMSGLAQLLHRKGHLVMGYDKTPSPLTATLVEQGIQIVFDDALAALPEKARVEDVQVIYTPAVPEDHEQLRYYLNHQYAVRKRAVFLNELVQASRCLAVAGTHGKTTTSSILTHMLAKSNASFTAFLGGVMQEYDSNLIAAGDEFSVVEADEYDRSFLQLHPEMAVITAVDPDHLDIYKTHEAMRASFEQFASQVTSTLVVEEHLPFEGIRYGFGEQADFRIANIQAENTGYRFDLWEGEECIPQVYFNLIGQHNLLNALGAYTLARQLEIPQQPLLEALADFPGVYRRMNIYSQGDRFLIDDYAHHPEEIRAVWNTVKEHFPEQHKTVVFQPHLFSRTQDFMSDFAEVLSNFDRVVLLEIYPARELPIPGVNSQALFEKIAVEDKFLVDKSDLLTFVNGLQTDVLALLGAGDIGLEVEPIRNKWLKEV